MTRMLLSVRLPAGLVEDLDRWAAANGLSRTAVIERLLEVGLGREESEVATPVARRGSLSPSLARFAGEG